MTTRAIFSLLSSVVLLAGAIPYFIDIHHGKARPHILSWIGWAFITALGASAMHAEGSRWVIAILVANSFNSLFIAAYATFKKVGIWSTGIYDYIFIGLGALGLVLWQTLDMPILALVSAITADLCFGIPTIIKTYKNPATETRFVWTAAAASGLLSLFAIQTFAFYEVAYPLYLFIFDATVLMLVLKIVKNPHSPK